MKIRNGFVSNSSSSSFCILGITSEELIKNGLKLPEEIEESGDDYEYWYQYDKDFAVVYGIEDYYEQYVIGRSVEKLDENKTILESKKEIANLINEKFKVNITENDIDFRVDGGF